MYKTREPTRSMEAVVPDRQVAQDTYSTQPIARSREYGSKRKKSRSSTSSPSASTSRGSTWACQVPLDLIRGRPPRQCATSMSRMTGFTLDPASSGRSAGPVTDTHRQEHQSCTLYPCAAGRIWKLQMDESNGLRDVIRHYEQRWMILCSRE